MPVPSDYREECQEEHWAFLIAIFLIAVFGIAALFGTWCLIKPVLIDTYIIMHNLFS